MRRDDSFGIWDMKPEYHRISGTGAIKQWGISEEKTTMEPAVINHEEH
jgi:hypothetical protein